MMVIAGDGGPGRLQPRDGSPDGHMEWIRQLKGLDVCGRLQLSFKLRTGDLCCLGQTLPGLKDLDLAECSFPVAALPILRQPMVQLVVLELGFSHCGPVDRGTLEAVMLQLCRPQHGGAAPLKNLISRNVRLSPALPDTMEVRVSVEQQLADCFGVTGVDINLW